MDNQNETKLLNDVNTSDPFINAIPIGDAEVPLFLSEWLGNGLNASAAYQKLHPDVTGGSARVLGSRKLAKVNTSAILVAYGVDYSDFFKQLKDGLGAMKWNEFSGEQVPDHRIRLEYLKLVGKMLDVFRD